MDTLLQLLWSFIQIGLFSFGGGYAAIPLLQHQVIDVNGWLTIGEFTDLITISQMTPGPISINAATFVGLKVYGQVGAVVATIGCILPSCIIVSLLAWIYTKYNNLSVMQGILGALRPMVVALIAKAGIDIMISAFFLAPEISISNIDIISVGLFIGGLFALRKFKVNPIAVMFSTGVLGGVLYSVFG